MLSWFNLWFLANPAEFVARSNTSEVTHEQVLKARAALEAVKRAIRDYETRRYQLQEGYACTNARARPVTVGIENDTVSQSL